MVPWPKKLGGGGGGGGGGEGMCPPCPHGSYMPTGVYIYFI